HGVFFFFQAEDGIRDGHVTGVQTCALPILSQRRSGSCREFVASRPQRSRSTVVSRSPSPSTARGTSDPRSSRSPKPVAGPCTSRSEERRVGKEGRSRGRTYL